MLSYTYVGIESAGEISCGRKGRKRERERTVTSAWSAAAGQEAGEAPEPGTRTSTEAQDSLRATPPPPMRADSCCARSSVSAAALSSPPHVARRPDGHRESCAPLLTDPTPASAPHSGPLLPLVGAVARRRPVTAVPRPLTASAAATRRRRRSSSTMMTTASDPAALRPVPCARRSSSTASCPRSAARARGRQGRRRRGDARRSVRRGGRCRKVRRNGGGRRKGWRGRGRGRRAARGRCLVGTRGGRRHHCPVRRTREVNDEKVQQEKGTTRRWATELVDEGEGGELGRLGNDLHLDALAPVLCEGCTVSSSRTGVGMTGERRAHLRRM